VNRTRELQTFHDKEKYSLFHGPGNIAAMFIVLTTLIVICCGLKTNSPFSTNTINIRRTLANIPHTSCVIKKKKKKNRNFGRVKKIENFFMNKYTWEL